MKTKSVLITLTFYLEVEECKDVVFIEETLTFTFTTIKDTEKL